MVMCHTMESSIHDIHTQGRGMANSRHVDKGRGHMQNVHNGKKYQVTNTNNCLINLLSMVQFVVLWVCQFLCTVNVHDGDNMDKGNVDES